MVLMSTIDIRPHFKDISSKVLNRKFFRVCRERSHKIDEKEVNCQFISYFLRNKKLKHSAAADRGLS